MRLHRHILHTFAAAAILGLSHGNDAMAGTPFNGLILDSDMTPVKKARIHASEERRYTLSDKHGRFGLTDVAPDDTLTINIGKKRIIRIPVAGRKSMKIILAGGTDAAASEDDDLVNLGYGYVKRREHTGVSSGISGDQLRQTGQRHILQALSGLVAGLNITQTNGELDVNIRGQKSLTSSNSPIYIVDGVQVNSLDFVSVYDVDHVEVLKDAAIYGSRGANGAILVTTKANSPRQ